MLTDYRLHLLFFNMNKSKSYISFFIFLFLLVDSNPIKAYVKYAVLFGNHSEIIKTLDGDVFRIFMDMNGDYYPENIISNEELRDEGNSQLRVWAKEFPTQFTEIAEAYKLLETDYSTENYQILQDSIRSSILKILNREGRSEQTWILHGYRKDIQSQKVDNGTSVSDNRIGRRRIQGFYKNSSHLFIEVYWDGKYIASKGIIRLIKMGKIYKNHAIPNAHECGNSLRKIFAKIACQKINLLSHSTSTYIVSGLLFNVKSNQDLPTPDQNDIRIALTASASPGKKLFKKYYERNTSYDYQIRDNYSLYNFMNKRDFVLSKSMGKIGFARFMGNTTLGCDYKNESKKLKAYFEENFINSTYLEGEFLGSYSHLFGSYVESEGFDGVLKFLYE